MNTSSTYPTRIDLFFVVMCKDNYVLYAEQGPFIVEDEARTKAEERMTGRCYRRAVKVTLPCEVLE